MYADAARVELWLNGRRVGADRPGRDDDYLTRFTLPYQPGELTAVAYGADGAEIGRQSLTSAGAGLRLVVEPETTELVADGHDLAYLPIALTDDDGILRPLADRSVTVTVEGAATLLGLGSGEPITEERFAGSSHRTFNGRALAVLRAGHEPGDVHVTVAASGVTTVSTTLRVVPAPARRGDEKSSRPALDRPVPVI